MDIVSNNVDTLESANIGESLRNTVFTTNNGAICHRGNLCVNTRDGTIEAFSAKYFDLDDEEVSKNVGVSWQTGFSQDKPALSRLVVFENLENWNAEARTTLTESIAEFNESLEQACVPVAIEEFDPDATTSFDPDKLEGFDLGEIEGYDSVVRDED